MNRHRARASWPRRKWARRGRAVGDALASFAAAVMEHVAVAMVGLVGWASSRFLLALASLWRRLPRHRGGVSPTATPPGSATSSAAQERVQEPEDEYECPSPAAFLDQVTFNDVVGLDEAKEVVARHVLLPHRHREHAESLGLKPTRGILLFGPPGTGKTLLARAIVGEIGQGAPVHSISPKTILARWEGSERRAAEVIRRARSSSGVVILDEAEALLGRRGSSGLVGRRLLSTLLAELQGVEIGPGLILIAMTNRPWDIDPAMLRPGRFDALCYAPLPEETARRAILRLNLRGRAVSANVSEGFLDELASRTRGLSGADIRDLVIRAAGLALQRAAEAEDARAEIRAEDLLESAAAARPSVLRTEIERYARFVAEHRLSQNQQPGGDRFEPPRDATNDSRKFDHHWACGCGHYGERPLLRLRDGFPVLLCPNPACRHPV